MTDWPKELPGIGTHSVGVFDLCTKCRLRWTWSQYGGETICLPCAIRLAPPAEPKKTMTAGEVRDDLRQQRERRAQTPTPPPPKRRRR